MVNTFSLSPWGGLSGVLGLGGVVSARDVVSSSLSSCERLTDGCGLGDRVGGTAERPNVEALWRDDTVLMPGDFKLYSLRFSCNRTQNIDTDKLHRCKM